MRYPNNREKALTQARLPRVLSYRAVTCRRSPRNKLSKWDSSTNCHYLLVLNAWSPTLSDLPSSPEDPNLAHISYVIGQAISLCMCSIKIRI